jgi:amino-acid N-acetyltransferase
VQLREAEPEDIGSVLELLRRCGLPTDGVPDEAEALLVAREDGRVVGVAGLELHGGEGLLRSVATAQEFRGRRVASRLCDEVEKRAHSLGVTRLYLLTETAEAFFAKRGYRRVERANAPRGIASSKEFATLCPVSSALMVSS